MIVAQLYSSLEITRLYQHLALIVSQQVNVFMLMSTRCTAGGLFWWMLCSSSCTKAVTGHLIFIILYIFWAISLGYS